MGFWSNIVSSIKEKVVSAKDYIKDIYDRGIFIVRPTRVEEPVSFYSGEGGDSYFDDSEYDTRPEVPRPSGDFYEGEGGDSYFEDEEYDIPPRYPKPYYDEPLDIPQMPSDYTSDIPPNNDINDYFYFRGKRFYVNTVYITPEKRRYYDPPFPLSKMQYFNAAEPMDFYTLRDLFSYCSRLIDHVVPHQKYIKARIEITSGSYAPNVEPKVFDPMNVDKSDNDLRFYSTTYSEDVGDTFKNKVSTFDREGNKDSDSYIYRLYQVKIIYVLEVPLVGQGNPMPLSKVTEKWITLGTRNNVNCGYVSVYTAAMWKVYPDILTDQNKRNKRASEFKEQILLSSAEQLPADYVDDRHFILMSKYLQITINLYNNVYEKIKIFYPDGMKTKSRNAKKCEKIVDIFFSQGHYEALIPRKDLDERGLSDIIDGKPSIIPDGKNLKSESKKTVMEAMKKKYRPRSDNVVFGTYDIETCIDRSVLKTNDPNDESNTKIKDLESFKYASLSEDRRHVAYKIGFTFGNTMEEAEINYQEYTGLDCIEKFFVRLRECAIHFKQRGLKPILYAHNGGKFDFNILMNSKQNIFTVKNNSVINSNGRWISITLRARYSGQGIAEDYADVKFGDTYAMLSGSLDDLAKSFDVKYKKINEKVEHHKIFTDNFIEKSEEYEIAKYLKHDVLGLQEIVIKFNKVLESDKFKMNMYDIPTAASLSKNLYFTKYYNSEKTPIYVLPKEIDEFIRKSYKGGRVECFYIGHMDKKVYYYDVTSEYPFTACKQLPYGAPVKMRFRQSPKESSLGEIPLYEQPKNEKAVPYGFWRVLVRGGPSIEPKGSSKQVHCYKGKVNIFPYFENWTEDTIFSEEIIYGMKRGYEYKFIDGYTFKKSNFLAPVMTDLFAFKDQYKKTDPTLSQVYKIILNSLYGGFGLNWTSRSCVNIDNISGVMKLFYDNKLDYVRQLFGTDNYLIKTEKEISANFISVPIASAITSYARIYLHGIMENFEKRGINVLYCDTDSVIVDAPMPKEINEIYNEFPGKLGSLANEAIKKIPKDFQVYEKGEEPGFDGAYIAGPKMYYIYKRKGEETWGSGTLKGFSQRDFGDRKTGDTIKNTVTEDHFKTLVSGGQIDQVAMQLRCGARNQLSETSNFAVQEKAVIKKFKLNYNKGTVTEEGWVIPLSI